MARKSDSIAISAIQQRNSSLREAQRSYNPGKIPEESGTKREGEGTLLGGTFCTHTLDYNSLLDFNAIPARRKLTQIMCAIGPASRDPTMLANLMDAGMNICCLNSSQGPYTYLEDTLIHIRDAAAKGKRQGELVCIALEVKGPEITTGLIQEGMPDIMLTAGSIIRVTSNEAWSENCSSSILWIDYPPLTHALKEGSIICLDDGAVLLEVLAKEDSELMCSVIKGGRLGNKKPCRLPNVFLELPAVSEKTHEDLQFAVTQNVDMVIAPFVQNAQGINDIREIVRNLEKEIKIVAKIESSVGLSHFPEILKAADAILISRDGLGWEIPKQRIFMVQKWLTAKCMKAGKPVIFEGHFLESMTYNATPTRAESTDVATAVMDGVDCIKLENVSRKGQFPLETVEHVTAVCLDAEMTLFSEVTVRELRQLTPLWSSTTRVAALGAVDAALQQRAAAIIACTTSGHLVHVLSSYRPRCPIIMVSRDEVASRQALLYRGVLPQPQISSQEHTKEADISALLQSGIQRVIKSKMADKGDVLVLLFGWKGERQRSYCIKIIPCP